MSQVPGNQASSWLLWLSPYLWPQNSERINILSLNQLLRTGFPLSVARFPNASYLSPCSFFAITKCPDLTDALNFRQGENLRQVMF